MAKDRKEIHDRIYKFALQVLKIVSLVPKSTENVVILRQVVRSSGSIGANALEADGSETRKEFIHRFAISKKEAKETFYWLSLLSYHNNRLKKHFTPLLDECRQLILIISKIVLNTKKSGV